MSYTPPNINGQATMANSAPVVVASNQTAIPISDGGGSVTVDGAVTITTTDIAPATQNITVIDSSSSTATGANNQSIVIGTPTAGSAASFALSSIETVRVEVTGIWTGTLTAEQSIDGGTTWTSQGLHQGSYTTASFTAGFIGGANVAGATNFRMRATAAITGTAVVKVIESINTQSVYVANAAPAGNVISTLNSSTATLTAGSVFTGTSEDVSNFSEMRVSVWASHASATDGLSIQQSSNGTNWDITDTYTIAATTGKTFVVPRQARFIRVVYTNGGTNQSSFRLQVILNRTATASSSQRAQDGYSNENDLEQVWAFGSFYNGTTWDMARGDTTNGLDVDVTRLPALVAGSSIIGKVTTDQTTHGTTDLVAADITKIGGSALTIGQQIAAASIPVILPSATITTLTPPTSVTATQATGTNLHTVVDSGTITTVTTLTGTTTLTPGTGTANLGKAEDAVHASGDTGVFGLGVGNEAQTTLASDGDYIGHATDTKGNGLVVGNLAHDAVDAGSPLKIGGQARTTNPTAVSDADRSNFITDKLGKQIVVGSIRDLKVNTPTTITSSTSETTVITAVASTFLDVYGCIVANTSATACSVAFKDATSGTTQFTVYVPAGDTRGFMLPEGGAIKQGTVNNNWTATCSASVASIAITMLAVKNI